MRPRREWREGCLFSHAFLKSHIKNLMKARLLTTLLAPENYFARSIRDDELGGVV